ncbi:MAG: aminopeptidase [Anaerolineae bacterium]
MQQIAFVQGAKKLVEICAGVKAGENLLIVTDIGRPLSVAQALALAGENVGANVILTVMKPVPTGQEPPAPVKGAMLSADVILAPTSGSMFHTNAAREAVAAGARLISLTEMSEALLVSGAILADFEAQAPVIEAVRQLLTNADKVHITAPGGTDVTMSLAGREAMKITSLAREPGIRTAGLDLEAFIAPVEGTAEGVVVIDASASNMGLVRTPLRMELKEGRVVKISGGAQARGVEKSLAKTNHAGSYAIAELGIGLNPSGLVRGQIVEDEGVYGTAHIALGNNTNFVGGQNWAPIHFDYVFWEPTIELDGKVIMAAGGLVDA